MKFPRPFCLVWGVDHIRGGGVSSSLTPLPSGGKSRGPHPNHPLPPPFRMWELSFRFGEFLVPVQTSVGTETDKTWPSLSQTGALFRLSLISRLPDLGESLRSRRRSQVKQFVA